MFNCIKTDPFAFLLSLWSIKVSLTIDPIPITWIRAHRISYFVSILIFIYFIGKTIGNVIIHSLLNYLSDSMPHQNLISSNGNVHIIKFYLIPSNRNASMKWTIQQNYNRKPKKHMFQQQSILNDLNSLIFQRIHFNLIANFITLSPCTTMTFSILLDYNNFLFISFTWFILFTCLVTVIHSIFLFRFENISKWGENKQLYLKIANRNLMIIFWKINWFYEFSRFCSWFSEFSR